MSVDDNYTKSLLHFEGANASTIFTDESGKVWTPSSGTIISTAKYKFGSASGLFSSGKYISTPAVDDLTVGSGDWTVDVWVHTTSTAAGQGVAVYSGSTGSITWCLLLRNGSSCRFYSSSNGSTWNAVNVIVGTLVINQWHHVAISRSSNYIYTFFDGVKTNTTDVTGLTLTVPGLLHVGGVTGDAGSSWIGYIDEFRLSKGIARWTSNFTPET
jgi:hypothetical protein